jgi:chromosome segregation ATPase
MTKIEKPKKKMKTSSPQVVEKTAGTLRCTRLQDEAELLKHDRDDLFQELESARSKLDAQRKTIQKLEAQIEEAGSATKATFEETLRRTVGPVVGHFSQLLRDENAKATAHEMEVRRLREALAEKELNSRVLDPHRILTDPEEIETRLGQLSVGDILRTDPNSLTDFMIDLMMMKSPSNNTHEEDDDEITEA